MLLQIFVLHINILKYLVHKLLATITRFFVHFVKVPALLKISIVEKYISFFCLVCN